MGDPFRKVRSGDPLAIPARAYNAFIDAAVDLRNRRQAALANTGRPDSRPGIITVRNDTGYDLSQFSVVGLGSPLYGPLDNENEFRFNPALKAVVPVTSSHRLSYGITQEPIPADKLGACLVAGFTVCRLKIVKSWHRYAAPVDSETGYLESAASGDAVIQWSAGGESGPADWALVTIKSGEPTVTWGKTLTNWHNGSGNGSYVEVNPCKDRNGSDPDSSRVIRVWLPRHGRDEDPNVVAGEVVPFVFSDATVTPQEGVCICDYLDGKVDVSLRLIMKNADVPEGWEEWTDADKKVLCMNRDPDGIIEGYDWHGKTENNHDPHDPPGVEVPCTSLYEGDKYPANVGRCGPADVTFEPGDPGSDHNGPFHDGNDTVNWPPFMTVKVIKRIDNSA